MRLSVALVLAILPCAAVAADVDKVLECMRANIPSTVRIQTVEIAAYDRSGGERVLRGKIYGTREDGRVRVNTRIEAPPDLAGAAYLVREGDAGDEMYMFLPALNKVRRITGAAMDGKLWGTDLSYNDVKQVQNAFAGGTTRLEGAAEIEKRPVQVVHFTPRAQDSARYEQLKAFVDRQTCVALRTEFYEGGTLRKEITVQAKDLKQSGTHWYAAAALVKDLKDGTHTRLRVLGVTAGDKLAGRYFSPTQFYLGN